MPGITEVARRIQKAHRISPKVNGIWLLETQVSVQYDDNGKLMRIVSNSLLEARFNDLPDEFFAIPNPQGHAK